MTQRRVGRAGRAELLAEQRIVGTFAGQVLADHPLDRLVGVADRRQVGLGVDDEVGRAEAGHRDHVGVVGHSQRERQVVNSVI